MPPPNAPRDKTLARRWVHVSISIPISSGAAARLSDLILAGTIIAPSGEAPTLAATDLLSAVVQASSTVGFAYGGKSDSTPFTVPAGGELSDRDIPAAYWPRSTFLLSAGAAYTAHVRVLLA